MDCVLAYDLGTSGVKAVLVQKDGSLLATATENYPLLRPAEGWAEQRPEDYWSSVCRVTHGVLRKAGVQADCVAGIAFGTLWKGIIPVSSHGEVLHNSILWLDSRAAEQAKRINAHFPGVQYHESDYWPKLLWLRENRPEVIEKAEWILEVNAFLKWKATGIAAVDMSNSYLRSLDGKTDSYYKELLEYMDIPREKIPPVVHSTDLVGYVTPEAAEALGVLTGTPVFGGNNDIQGVCVGAGCSHIGGTHAYLGSSGWIGFTLGHGTAPANSPFDESRDILIASTRAACLSLNWVVSNLYHAEQAALGDAVFEELEREMAAVPPGAEGLLATPWLYEGKGQMHSCFLNLKATHTRGHMARAVLESVCYQLRQVTQRACETKGLKWPEK
jgi:xylulokinase